MKRSLFNPIFVCPVCTNKMNLSVLNRNNQTCKKCGTTTKVELKNCEKCKDYFEMKYTFENKGKGIKSFLSIPCQTCAERRYTGPADINVLCMSCFEETNVRVRKLPLNGIIRSQCDSCSAGFTICLNPGLKSYKYTIVYDSGAITTMDTAPEIPTGSFVFVCPGCKKKKEVDIVESPDFFAGVLGLDRAKSVGKPVMPQSVMCECGLSTIVTLNRCRICNDGFEMDYKYVVRPKTSSSGSLSSHEIPCSVCSEHLYNGPDGVFWICGMCSTGHRKNFKKYPPNGIFVNKCKKCGESVTLFLTPQDEGYTCDYITHTGGNRFRRQDTESYKYHARKFKR